MQNNEREEIFAAWFKSNYGPGDAKNSTSKIAWDAAWQARSTLPTVPDEAMVERVVKAIQGADDGCDDDPKDMVLKNYRDMAAAAIAAIQQQKGTDNDQ